MYDIRLFRNNRFSRDRTINKIAITHSNNDHLAVVTLRRKYDKTTALYERTVIQTADIVRTARFDFKETRCSETLHSRITQPARVHRRYL